MKAREQADLLRKEITEQIDKYNRANDFDDPGWIRNVLNGLFVLRDSIKDEERKYQGNEDTISSVVRWYLKNAPKKQRRKVYSLCATKDDSDNFAAFEADCRKGTISETDLEIIVIALPFLIEELEENGS